MNFMFDWQEQYLTSECSERVRYCSCHENIHCNIHIFELMCNVLFIIWRLNKFNDFLQFHGRNIFNFPFLVTGVKIFFKNFYVVQGFLLRFQVFLLTL